LSRSDKLFGQAKTGHATGHAAMIVCIQTILAVRMRDVKAAGRALLPARE
jgi:hypothetical protein